MIKFIKKNWLACLLAGAGIFLAASFWSFGPDNILETEIEHLEEENKPENETIAAAEDEVERLIAELKDREATVDLLTGQLATQDSRLIANSETIKRLMAVKPENPALFQSLEDCKNKYGLQAINFNDLKGEYSFISGAYKTSKELNEEYKLTVTAWKKIDLENNVIINAERNKYSNCLKSLENVNAAWKKKFKRGRYGTALTIASGGACVYLAIKKNYIGAAGAVLSRLLIRRLLKI